MPATEAPAWTFGDLDPGTLLVDANVRLDPRLDKDFLASINEDGILVPILAVRTPDGQVRVRDGHRRVLAAIQAGHTAVPVIIAGDEETGKAAAIERIIGQFNVNTHRTGLTAAEKASVVTALFELEVPAATVQKRTRLPQEQVDAARRVADSETAKKLAAQYPLDLEQTAVLAEFDDDPETAGGLAVTARDNPGQFAHVAQRARDARADREALDAHTAKLAKQGITVSRESQHWENRIDNWTDADGNRLTAKTHKKCPGNVAVLHAWGGKVQEGWYCTDPKGNGHKRYRLSGGTDQSPEERKRVLDGNKAWRSAEKVRRDWLREFLARPKVPDGALSFTLQAFALSDNRLLREMQYGNDGRHVMARELLGLPKGEGSGWNRPPEVWTAMTKASPARAQVIALALVLGAYEGSTSVHSWRNPDTGTVEYLETLAGWGYPLSDIEQQLVDTARKREAEHAAVIKQDEAAAAEHDGASEESEAAATAAGEDSPDGQ